VVHVKVLLRLVVDVNLKLRYLIFSSCDNEKVVGRKNLELSALVVFVL
jgi:hypothetical protein